MQVTMKETLIPDKTSAVVKVIYEADKTERKHHEVTT